MTSTTTTNTTTKTNARHRRRHTTRHDTHTHTQHRTTISFIPASSPPDSPTEFDTPRTRPPPHTVARVRLEAPRARDSTRLVSLALSPPARRIARRPGRRRRRRVDTAPRDDREIPRMVPWRCSSRRTRARAKRRDARARGGRVRARTMSPRRARRGEGRSGRRTRA